MAAAKGRTTVGDAMTEKLSSILLNVRLAASGDKPPPLALSGKRILRAWPLVPSQDMPKAEDQRENGSQYPGG